jgi:hypothetical protein
VAITYIDKPGIGMIASKHNIFTMFGFWDESINNNKWFMKYATEDDPELYDSDGNRVPRKYTISGHYYPEAPYGFMDYYVENSLNVTRDINMNNNKLIVDPYNTSSINKVSSYDDFFEKKHTFHRVFVDSHRIYNQRTVMDVTGFGVTKYRVSYTPENAQGATSGSYFDFVI